MEQKINHLRQQAVETSKQETSQPKQKQTRPSNHSEHAHDQLDSDCEGCQAEKKENQKLVDFYKRLDMMSTKVSKIKFKKNQINTSPQTNPLQSKQSPTKQINNHEGLSIRIKQLDQKLNISELPSANEIKNFNSKQIGFQLAAALIEREMKYKSQNKKLQQKINELLAEKQKKSQFNQKTISYNTPQIDIFSNIKKMDKFNQPQPGQGYMQDSLDYLKGSQNINKRKVKIQKADSSFWDIDTSSTNHSKYQNTSFLQNRQKIRPKLIDKNKSLLSQQTTEYSMQNSTLIVNQKKKPLNTGGHGLNLWLYQFKTEDNEQKLESSWIQNKNNPQKSERYNYLSKNTFQTDEVKSPRLTKVNKTTIIQKNLIHNEHLTQVARKKRS